MNTLAEVAISEDSIIEEYLSGLREKVFEKERINPKEYLKLSIPVKMRFLHEYIQKFDIDYDYKKIKEIYTFIENNIDKRNGTTISLSTNKWLYVDERIIETIPNKSTLSLDDELLKSELIIDSEGEYIFGDRKIFIKSYTEKELFVFPESTAR